jgi:hypothetical protein
MSAAGGPSPSPIGRRALLAGGLGLTGGTLLSGCTGEQPAPTPAPPGFRTPPPRREPGPDFLAADGFVYAPDGSLFTPVGANVGTTGSFDWKGVSQGHADAALAWGWNTVRLNLMVTGASSWSFVAQRGRAALLDLVSRIVDEYTAAGIVVILDAHDNPKAKGLDQRKVEDGLESWWEVAGAAFTDNPRVWSGLINEPAYTNDEWVALMDRLAGAVRGTGNRAPVLLGASCWGQDVAGAGSFAGARFCYEPSMAPSVSDRYPNVILEQHNYGAFGLYSSAEKFGRYVETVRGQGLTPLIGEFGFTVSKNASPDIYQANYDAAQAVFEIAAQRHVGALWWHATHGDNYSLMADGGAFWKGRDGAGLSEGGDQVWRFGHRDG